MVGIHNIRVSGHFLSRLKERFGLVQDMVDDLLFESTPYNSDELDVCPYLLIKRKMIKHRAKQATYICNEVYKMCMVMSKDKELLTVYPL